MPEMPEVETVRRTLEAKLLGKTIVEVNVRLARLIKTSGSAEFCTGIVTRTIDDVRRIGKGLVLILSGGRALVIHLRMTGRLYLRSESTVEDSFMRISFILDTGEELLYADARTLGTLHLVELTELDKIPYLKKLGPEPLSRAFTLSYLVAIMRKSRGKIKGFLLDQHKIAGLGNIYVDEALHRAGIHPCRLTYTLDEVEQRQLYESINEIIAAAIENRGTSFRDYVDGAGRKGDNQRFLRVYGRSKEPCQMCGSLIRRIVVVGRGTHYCPNCQPEEGGGHV